jgi:diguanylate cyclase
VCETAARWAAAGIDHRLSMNLSPRELTHPDFFERFEAAMVRHHTPPHMLELEIGESLAMSMQPALIARVQKLRARGVSVAIDDFGTGLSNLSRLKDLPIDRVKIDRTLVRDIAVSAEARTICSAVVALVHGLGLKVVIEGVESEDQIEILRVIGCHVFQGFHLSRPIDEGRYVARFGPAAQDDADAQEA